MTNCALTVSTVSIHDNKCTAGYSFKSTDKHINSYVDEQSYRSYVISCACCKAWISDSQATPEQLTSAEWKAARAQHEPGCGWVAAAGLVRAAYDAAVSERDSDKRTRKVRSVIGCE